MMIRVFIRAAGVIRPTIFNTVILSGSKNSPFVVTADVFIHQQPEFFPAVSL